MPGMPCVQPGTTSASDVVNGWLREYDESKILPGRARDADVVDRHRRAGLHDRAGADLQVLASRASSVADRRHRAPWARPAGNAPVIATHGLPGRPTERVVVEGRNRRASCRPRRGRVVLDAELLSLFARATSTTATATASTSPIVASMSRWRRRPPAAPPRPQPCDSAGSAVCAGDWPSSQPKTYQAAAPVPGSL